jgi:hypothetical protein
MSDHDTSRPTATKPYLKTLAQSRALSNEEINNNNSEGASSTTAADFEHVKAMLEAAISEKCSVFISYLAEKMPASEEGGKKKRKKKREQPMLINTYKKITLRSFEKEKCEVGLKVIADCNLRDGEKCEFFLYKITKIKDHDWKGTWKSQTLSKYSHIHLLLCLYLSVY